MVDCVQSKKETKKNNLMYWIQFLIMLVSFVGLFIWNRRENKIRDKKTEHFIQTNEKLINLLCDE